MIVNCQYRPPRTILRYLSGTGWFDAYVVEAWDANWYIVREVLSHRSSKKVGAMILKSKCSDSKRIDEGSQFYWCVVE